VSAERIAAAGAGSPVGLLKVAHPREDKPLPAADGNFAARTPLSALLRFFQRKGWAVGLLEDLWHVGDGIKSGVEDAEHAVSDVVHGKVHEAVTDVRKLFGDAGDVLKGLEGLGMNLGPLPKWYKDSPFGKLSDSPILSLAQLVIKGEKALTGSGDPEDGNSYRDSAKRLAGAVETLIDAKPAPGRWDGAAADQYTTTNHDHRVRTSNVQAADEKIGVILSNEAAQVSDTRHTLESTSQDLYDYGLSTAWMNFIPPLRVTKLILDGLAATAGLETTSNAMSSLIENAVVNAADIHALTHQYATAAIDTSGDGGRACGEAFVSQNADLARLPSRLDSKKPYTVPDPEHPHDGPPATPYGSAGQTPPAAPAPGAPSNATPTPAAPPPAAPVGGAPAAAPAGPAAPAVAQAMPSSYTAAGSGVPQGGRPATPFAAVGQTPSATPAFSPTAPSIATPTPAVPPVAGPAPGTPTAASTGPAAPANAPTMPSTAMRSTLPSQPGTPVTDGAAPAPATNGRQRAPVGASAGIGSSVSVAQAGTSTSENQPPTREEP
jgi:hypothetical protein